MHFNPVNYGKLLCVHLVCVLESLFCTLKTFWQDATQLEDIRAPVFSPSNFHSWLLTEVQKVQRQLQALVSLRLNTQPVLNGHSLASTTHCVSGQLFCVYSCQLASLVMWIYEHILCVKWWCSVMSRSDRICFRHLRSSFFSGRKMLRLERIWGLITFKTFHMHKNLYDGISSGITAMCTVIKNGNFLSFQKIINRFFFFKQDHFRYLQILTKK